MSLSSPRKSKRKTGSTNSRRRKSVTNGGYQLLEPRQMLATMYYVNDSFYAPSVDHYTTAAGDPSNTGLTPDSPRDSLQSIFDDYKVGPDSTIFIDDGTFVVEEPIFIGKTLGDDSGDVSGRLTIQGAVAFGAESEFDAQDKQIAIFALRDADYVTMTGLTIAGGAVGVTVGVDSDHVLISQNQFRDAISFGVYAFESSESGESLAISHNVIHDVVYGIFVASGWSDVKVFENEVFGNQIGIFNDDAQDVVVDQNDVYGNRTGIVATGEMVVVSNNDVFDNVVGIESESANQGGIIGNRVYENGTGIFGGFYISENAVYSNTVGITGATHVVNNEIFDNEYGVSAVANVLDGLAARVVANQIYSNAIGIQSFGATIENNYIFENESVGVWIRVFGIGATISNNTLDQQGGVGIRIDDIDVTIRDNIFSVHGGLTYDVDVEISSPVNSDYNLFYHEPGNDNPIVNWRGHEFDGLAEWSLETGADLNSLFADPDFDDDYVAQNPIIVDRGDVNSYYLGEPNGGGGRVNIGANGNSPNAQTNPDPFVRVVSPNGGEKLVSGKQELVEFRAWGFGDSNTIAMLNAGSDTTIGSWLSERYVVGFSSERSYDSEIINVDNVVNPPPQEVYRSVANAVFEGEEIEYQLPLADGNYQIRLHLYGITDEVGRHIFDIVANGEVIENDYDIASVAGAAFTATVVEFDLSASMGSGLNLKLINERFFSASLAAIEITAATESQETTVSLGYSSDDGQTYSDFAQNLSFDRYGSGSFVWTVPEVTNGNVGRIRATANAVGQSDESDAGFRILDTGTSYYVNDTFEFGEDRYTTKSGDYLNTGKSPSQPLPSINAVLDTYNLDEGDTIFVDGGNYDLYRNIVIEDSGVVIQGPNDGSSPAVVNRGVAMGSSYAFELDGASNVAIKNLDIVGGDAGIEIRQGHDITIANNRFSGSDVGVHATGAAGNLNADGWTIAHNLFSNLGIGIDGSFGDSVISDNVIANVMVGMDVSGSQLVVTRNEIFNIFDAGIVASEATILDNTLFQIGQEAIDSRFASVVGNTVFETGTGVVDIGGRVDSNRIYSSQTGIVAGGGSQVVNNLIYEIATNAVSIPMNHASISGNTIQSNGVGIFSSNLGQTDIYNNIISVVSGFALHVDSLRPIENIIDRNAYDTGNSVGGAQVAFWDGIAFDQLADWQNTLGFDLNSVDADPLFVDPDGVDGVLGGAETGQDDNFGLLPNSPAIDAADLWHSTPNDGIGRTRIDDPTIANVGTDYQTETLKNSLFSSGGIGQEFPNAQESFFYDFENGFEFNFYGRDYSRVAITQDGVLYFGSAWQAPPNSLENLINLPLIAPLWGDFSTLNAQHDVFIDTGTTDEVTIRWKVANEDFFGSEASFSVTLFSSGQIRFDYGEGNENLTPTVGISSGNGDDYIVAEYDGMSTLTDADSLLFTTSIVGFADIGAFEFAGSSDDASAPTVIGISPDFVANNGTGEGFSQMTIEFSEELNYFDANSASVFLLLYAGENGSFGDNDDEVVQVDPQFNVGSKVVTVNLLGGNLSSGNYLFVILSAPNSSMHDNSGNLLDGDDDGSAGGGFEREFTIVNDPLVVGVDSLNLVQGQLHSGAYNDLRYSDNNDLTLRRSRQSVTSVAEIEITGTSHSENPTSFEFVLEASVFARSTVTQTIWLFNYLTNTFEEVDSREASHFVDEVVSFEPKGDLSRFVESGTGEVKAKVKFQSTNPRRQFSANIDQIIWNIAD